MHSNIFCGKKLENSGDMVDKGYTAPTQREIEQCISIVTQKTIEDWIK